MKPSLYWQNFELGKEIEISCGFIYDGLRNLNEMESLHYEAEIFSVVYNLSVGLERLLKVAVVLLEFNDQLNYEKFEKSLITHNHLDLLKRVKCLTTIKTGKQQLEFLSYLVKFYKTFRYDRFTINTVLDLSKEKRGLLDFLKKYIAVESITTITGEQYLVNNWKVRKFIGKIIGSLTLEFYKVIDAAASAKNIYTNEIRYHTKAYKLLYGKEFDFYNEEILWKELLVFLITSKEKSKHLEYIKNIDPLNFDIALISDYLNALGGEVKKISVTEELKSLYESLDKKGDRLRALDLIGKPSYYFEGEE